jgi:hypothetical protein
LDIKGKDNFYCFFFKTHMDDFFWVKFQNWNSLLNLQYKFWHKKIIRAGGICQMVESLPSKCKALNSTPVLKSDHLDQCLWVYGYVGTTVLISDS